MHRNCPKYLILENYGYDAYVGVYNLHSKNKIQLNGTIKIFQGGADAISRIYVLFLKSYDVYVFWFCTLVFLRPFRNINSQQLDTVTEFLSLIRSRFFVEAPIANLMYTKS